MKRIFLGILAVLFVTTAVSSEAPNPFPRPPQLEPDVRFWTRVYTEVDTDGGLIHDNRRLDVVYEVIHFPPKLSQRGQTRRIKKVKERYKAILLALAKGKRQKLSSDEQRVLSLWPEGVSKKTLRAAARRLRFQRGQADRFRAGLIRSGAWEPQIRKILMEMGLPEQLVALPHVESSYNPAAYSRVGAAGIWQFTRPTGRRYMRVDHVLDERMDPLKATVAAAQLLEQNRAAAGTWPLAVTAYNHGLSGVRRAVRKLGTRDIVKIVRRYKRRNFRFASRNFYVAFLAAMEIHFNAEKYFGILKRDAPSDHEIVKLPAYVKVKALEEALGVDRSTLRELNRALRRAVWNGSKYVPRGYELRVPPGSAKDLIARLKAADQFLAQQPDRFYRVRRGDTLSTIAANYSTSVRTLSELNGLRSRHRIRIGQRLRLPISESARQTRVASTRPVKAKPEPKPVNRRYTVRRGDTLSTIARRFGVDQQELLAANSLPNKNRIYVGQSLLLASAAPTTLPEPPKREVETKTNTEQEPALKDAEPETEIAKLETTEPASMGYAAPEHEESPGPLEPSETPPELAADPSDYSVGSDGTIEVQAAETLGHYAEWLQLRASQLRRVNGMKYRDPIVVGRRLRLDFSRVPAEKFEEQRLAHHRAIQENFFARYQIAGARKRRLPTGGSLWLLSIRHDVPVWLIRQYNPDVDFDTAAPGTVVSIPRLAQRDDATQPAVPNQAHLSRSS